jgi:hypothetical protein
MNNRGLGRTMLRLPADTQAAKPQIILSIKYVPLLKKAKWLISVLSNIKVSIPTKIDSVGFTVVAFLHFEDDSKATRSKFDFFGFAIAYRRYRQQRTKI